MVCIDAQLISKVLIPYLSNKRYFSEIDLVDSFQQLSISDEVSDLLSVTRSIGKVSCTYLTYIVQFVTDIFQETIS